MAADLHGWGSRLALALAGPLDDSTMATLIMMRTQCCEAFKECGRRCSICPNRPENRQALLEYQAACRPGFGSNQGEPRAEAVYPSPGVVARELTAPMK